MCFRAMKYRSTRGKVSGLSFEEAVFSSYASDGGLFMPEVIPQVDLNYLQKWKSLSYLELCKEILSLFISQQEISFEDLSAIVDKAFADFGNRDIVSLIKVDEFYLLELFHGKTLVFKDIALGAVSQFMDYFLNKKKQNAIVLVATSGDTGGSAVNVARKSVCLDIICLFPVGRVNQIQQLQMTTVLDDNVHVLGGHGTSDDLDVPLKNCLMDKDYVKDNNLCTMNSINWSRMMVQIVHFFYAYLQVCGKVGETVKFSIPSGALGHASAACLAYKMGLPVKLLLAVNDNDITHQTISKGEFIPQDSVTYTWSSAMDIQVPYNMQRIFYFFSGMNCDVVDSLMNEFEEKNSLRIPEELRKDISEVISTYSVSSDETLATMKKCWQQHQYLLCPHTAVGVAGVWNERCSDNMKVPTVCVATASPAKFPEAVKAAGIEMPLPPELEKLLSSPSRYKEMKKGEDWEEIVRNLIGGIKERRAKFS